ncbi:MAG TPA: hydantoinase/oxoprolinase family protein [Anaerolineae bacterium]|nr:hydantoinase/oxoprolinase family protein [Anaerolineae bacterium]
MSIALGIDTGGTYTDAALVDYSTGQVLCSAKALTTRRDLALGIGEVIDRVFRACGAPDPAQVSLVSLSTTLATNAIVEGQGSPICLVLIGYDPELVRQYGFQEELATDDVVYLRGGHDIRGDEVAPLDEASLRQAVLARRERVEAFGVSGYFGVRNPAHERRARDLILELTGLPVTCGHELTSRLNSVRRATTVALNARLVPLLRELVETLGRTLAERAIHAPLMVVKGDGSLVRAEWAMQRPIETILSGPAASAVGAWHLARLAGGDLNDGALWAVDVGGTTTDIAALRDGHPRLSPEGAQVGRWRTMVEAVDVHTIGLGGDSHVRLTSDRELLIGPQRVVPLSLLADLHPGAVAELRRQAEVPSREDVAAQFLLARRPPRRPLDAEETALLRRLSKGPALLSSLVRESRYGALLLRRIDRLAAEHLVIRAGFTPTDALHALGRLALWDAEASRLGAQILAMQRHGSSAGRAAADEFCLEVVEGVSSRAAGALVTKVLGDQVRLPDWSLEPTAALLLRNALGDGHDSELGYALTLRRPVVAIGAPVEAYMPRMAEMLHTRLVIPPHAEVANAVGAVAGGVIQRTQVLITLHESGGALRLHLPEGVHDFTLLEEAVACAQERMTPWMEERAREAGAGVVEVHMARRDNEAVVRVGWGDKIYLGTELTFTAAGRPSPAREA